MQRFNVRWLALLAITIIAIYLCWLIVEPFLDVIIWSVVLAVIAYPLHLRVRGHIKSPTLAAVSTVTLIVLIALVPLTVIAISAAQQVPEGIQALQGVIEHGKHYLSGNSHIAQMLRSAIGTDIGDNPQAITDKVKEVAASLAPKSWGLVGGVFGVLLKIAFTLFTLFYLLRDADEIGCATMNLLPLEEAQSRRVFRRCRDVIKASVEGVMVIAGLQALLGGIAFAVLGLPSAVLWGFVMFFAALIPAVGSTLVWGPAAIFLFASGHWGKAIVLIAFCGGVIGMLDNVLRPRLVGQKAGLHDLTIFFSVLGGLEAFGLPGLFIGPVVVALTLAVIEVFKQMSPTAAPARTVPAGIITDLNETAVDSGMNSSTAEAVHVPPVAQSDAGESAIIVP